MILIKNILLSYYNVVKEYAEIEKIKKYIYELIDQITEQDYAELIDFLKFLKIKSEKNEFETLENALQSSMYFWDNDIDDEVWNDA